MNIFVVLAIGNLLGFLLVNYVNVFRGKKLNLNKIYVGFLVLSALVLAYCTIPDPLDDLTRYYGHLDGFKQQGLAYLSSFPYKENILTTILFLIIYFIGNNHLLPVFVVSCYCFAIYTMFKKIKIKDNPAVFSLFILILYSFTYLNGMISSVRSPLAAALFIYLLFKDDNSKRYALLYFLPCLIHTSYLFMFGIMLITKFLNKQIPNKLIILVPYLAILVAFIFPSNIPLLSDAFERLLVYSNPIYSLQHIDIRLWLSSFSLFALITYLVISIRKKGVHLDNEILDAFQAKLMAIMIALVPFISIFSRFLGLYIITCLPFLTKINFKSKKHKIILFLFVFICLGVFAYRMVNAYHYWRFMTF